MKSWALLNLGNLFLLRPSFIKRASESHAMRQGGKRKILMTKYSISPPPLARTESAAAGFVTQILCPLLQSPPSTSNTAARPLFCVSLAENGGERRYDVTTARVCEREREEKGKEGRRDTHNVGGTKAMRHRLPRPIDPEREP